MLCLSDIRKSLCHREEFTVVLDVSSDAKLEFFVYSFDSFLFTKLGVFVHVGFVLDVVLDNWVLGATNAGFT